MGWDRGGTDIFLRLLAFPSMNAGYSMDTSFWELKYLFQSSKCNFIISSYKRFKERDQVKASWICYQYI